MKIRCQKQQFLRALQTITGIAVQKDIYPILENVRITTSGNQVILRATDLKISITYSIAQDKVNVIEQGEALLPALRLHNLIKETPDFEIGLEKDGLNGILISQDGKFTILGEDPAKFPEIPSFQEMDSFEVTGEDFKKLIKKTLFATTPEKTRYELDNILVNLMPDIIRFVATDGKRLAICDRRYQASAGVNLAGKVFTVPAHGLQQIDKVLSTTMPEKVILSFVENQLLFRTQEVVLSTRLSDAKFPPYEKVIPKELPFKATVAYKDFSSGLKRVCLLADEKNKIVTLFFSPTGLKLLSRGEGSGEGQVEIPMSFNGQPFQVKFNPTFLLDVLKVLDCKDIEFSLQDGQSAILLKDGDGLQYIVLPIKIEEEEKDGETE